MEITELGNMAGLQDLTPIFGNEHWETWLVMHRQYSRSWSWPGWIEMWRKPLDKYWDREDERIARHAHEVLASD